MASNFNWLNFFRDIYALLYCQEIEKAVFGKGLSKNATQLCIQVEHGNCHFIFLVIIANISLSSFHGFSSRYHTLENSV